MNNANYGVEGFVYTSENIKKLRTELQRMEKIIQLSPKGSINVSNIRNGVCNYRYSYRENGVLKRRHLSKSKDAKLIEQLSDKKYAVECAKNIKLLLKMNKNQTDKSLLKVGICLADELEKKHIFTTSKTQLSAEGKVKVWKEKKYISLSDTNSLLPQPKHKTASGILVRSKSEVMIADALLLLNIPFRYEAQLDLGEYGVVYPDFTMYNPYTDHECVYEHFGMMDDPDYEKKANEKINKLILSGKRYGRDFICTFESKDEPLTSDVVWALLKPYKFNFSLNLNENKLFAV